MNREFFVKIDISKLAPDFVILNLIGSIKSHTIGRD
ncbi:hypothetical protein DYBT9275_03877 [Dyadobacter sp. CECT 9275]|uniref:Uncharacterized protein n=1 Tax=Dyadobacter helix TaxID=2822344 RepID=A0A916JDF8_9BACT|nr:hypothetical protein DYBT9275_03877 [Dyadobacter sp. CECT 9275]